MTVSPAPTRPLNRPFDPPPRRPLSPRADTFRRPQAMTAAIVLLAIGGGISWVTYRVLSIGATPVSAKLSGSLFLGGPLLAAAAICLIVWLIGGIKARAFNRTDSALADGLAAALDRLWHAPPAEAYENPRALHLIPAARLVEIERHFDQQTDGAITGTLAHKLRMFGSSFSAGLGHLGRGGMQVSGSLGSFSGSINGLSQVDLGVNTTSRANLMGDALFAVFEATGPSGHRDTYRVISMSQPGVRGWIHALVQHAADQFGGPATHSGGTMLAWSGNLMAHFQPQDISYVTDRLKAVLTRSYDDREPVEIVGVPAGRNAVLATGVRIAGGEELRMLPSRFPELLGAAVAEGVAIGHGKLTGSDRQRQLTTTG